MEINVGDVVKLKSGGPLMTVIEIREKVDSGKVIGITADCVWYDAPHFMIFNTKNPNEVLIPVKGAVDKETPKPFEADRAPKDQKILSLSPKNTRRLSVGDIVEPQIGRLKGSECLILAFEETAFAGMYTILCVSYDGDTKSVFFDRLAYDDIKSQKV